MACIQFLRIPEVMADRICVPLAICMKRFTVILSTFGSSKLSIYNYHVNSLFPQQQQCFILQTLLVNYIHQNSLSSSPVHRAPCARYQLWNFEEFCTEIDHGANANYAQHILHLSPVTWPISVKQSSFVVKLPSLVPGPTYSTSITILLSSDETHKPGTRVVTYEGGHCNINPILTVCYWNNNVIPHWSYFYLEAIVAWYRNLRDITASSQIYDPIYCVAALRFGVLVELEWGPTEHKPVLHILSNNVLPYSKHTFCKSATACTVLSLEHLLAAFHCFVLFIGYQ